MNKKKITIEVTPRVEKFLEKLTSTEVYGQTVEETAEILIRLNMEDALVNDRLEKLQGKLN